MIKGFVMSDNNYLDPEWRMLICAGAGAQKIARELHSFKTRMQIFWNRQYADEMSNNVRVSHHHDISITLSN